MVLFVAPNKGGFWFADDGFFLQMAWNAAYGYGWDYALPQSPSYLVHASLMRLGMVEYLHFRYFHYTLMLVASLIFFCGLNKGRTQTTVLPVACCLGILVSLNSVQSPNSLVITFWMMGCGLFFLACSALRLRKNGLFLLSGLFFAIAGFMHAAAAVAVLLTILCIVLLAEKSWGKSYVFLPTFIVGFLLLWGWYIPTIGLEALLSHPVGHDASLRQLLIRIGLILTYFLKALLIYSASIWLGKKYLKLSTQTLRAILCLGSTMVAISALLSYLMPTQWPIRAFVEPLKIPGVIYYPLFFIFFEFVTAFNIEPTGIRGILTMNTSKICLWIKSLGGTISNLTWEQKKFLICFAGFLLLPASLAVGSNTAIIVGLVFFAGPAAGLSIMTWDYLKADHQKYYWVLPLFSICWVLVFFGVSFSYNHPSPERLFGAKKVLLTATPMDGLRVSERYQISMQEILSAYQSSHCQNRYLLILDYLPTLHFLLQHPAPREGLQYGVVRPMLFFPSDSILKKLDKNTGWCVIDATGIETEHEIQKNGGIDIREPVRTFLKNNSSNIYEINSPGPEIVGKIYFYSY